MRFLKFEKMLQTFHELNPITAVYYEEVRAHKGVDAAHIYGGFLATLTNWCEKNKIPYEGIPVGTIKKFATGKGNSNKEAMIQAAIEAGYSPEDDNAADAIHIMRYILDREKSC